MLQQTRRHALSNGLFALWTAAAICLIVHQGPLTLFSRQLPMDASRFREQQGFGYRYKPNAREQAALAQRDRLIILENGRALPEKSGWVGEVVRSGNGLYTVTAQNIWISSTNGSDPRERRNRYAISVPRPVPAGLNLLVLGGWVALAGHRWLWLLTHGGRRLLAAARSDPVFFATAILIVALRAVAVSYDEIVADQADARDYLALAKSWYYHSHPIWFTRLPVYPLFVAAAQPLGIPLRWLIELVQLGCYGLLAVAVGRFGVSRWVCLAIFGSMALSPQTADLNNYCLADTLYAPLLIAAAGAGMAAIASMSWRTFVGFGVLLGLLGDLREERIVLAPLAVLVIALAGLVGRGSLRQRVIVPAVCALLPWIAMSALFRTAFQAKTGLPGHCLLSTPGVTALMRSLHELSNPDEKRPMFVINEKVRSSAYDASPTLRERRDFFENAPWKQKVKSFTGIADFSADGIVWTAMDAFKVDGPFSVKKRDDLMLAATREIDQATPAAARQKIFLSGTFPVNETALAILRSEWRALIQTAFRQAFTPPQLGKFETHAAPDAEIGALYNEMAHRRTSLARRMDESGESRPMWIKRLWSALHWLQAAAVWAGWVAFVVAVALAIVRKFCQHSRPAPRDWREPLQGLTPLLFVGYLGASRIAFGVLVAVFFYPASRYFLPISLVSVPVLLIALDAVLRGWRAAGDLQSPPNNRATLRPQR